MLISSVLVLLFILCFGYLIDESPDMPVEFFVCHIFGIHYSLPGTPYAFPLFYWMVTVGSDREKNPSPTWTSWLNVECVCLSSTAIDSHTTVQIRGVVALGNVVFLINFLTFSNGLGGQFLSCF